MQAPRRTPPVAPSTVRPSGFTLIEVMIVVVILGILAAIALPQYNQFVQRSRITDATNAMNDFRTRMEQFYQDNRTYANAGACGVDAASTGATSFTLTCAGPSNIGYTLNADGNAAQGMTQFRYQLVVAAGGVTRRTVAVPPSWGAPNPACWQVRAGGHCQ